MGVMKENFLRNAHDTTFSPTGLYNFVKGSELNDSSGNGSAKNLTEYNAATDDSDFAFGGAHNASNETNDVIISSCAIYDQELTANQIKYLARKTLGYHRIVWIGITWLKISLR